MITAIKRNSKVVNAYNFLKALGSFVKFRPFLFLGRVFDFYSDYKKFRHMRSNEAFSTVNFLPCLLDKVTDTPMDPTYFYQDTWAARKIFSLSPGEHFDIGSSAKTMGLISQFVPVTMIDIRPLPLSLRGLNFKKGSILQLPFEDDSIHSLSSLCVVEHIGLGRYGDPLDPFGSERAIEELKRVLAVGGQLLVSIPVDARNTIYFNAHRAFTEQYILDLFDGLKLLESKYQYGNGLYDEFDPTKGFGTGLFMFTK